MGKIRQLSEDTANKIAAGEVVERPASVIKELVENSIDACAHKIDVEVVEGGATLMRIIDDGVGMSEEDAQMCFSRHATSKIVDDHDLFNITTLGFRGEALASISNVSQTAIETKTKDSEFAYRMEVNGGVFSEVEIASASNGTKIEVRNLFFNTPVRRKFLKKAKQEETQITNIITRYILANPEISFKYIVDGNIVYQNNDKTLYYANDYP